MIKKLICTILFVIILLTIYLIFQKRESKIKSNNEEEVIKITILQNPSEIDSEKKLKMIETSTYQDFTQKPIESTENDDLEEEVSLYPIEY